MCLTGSHPLRAVLRVRLMAQQAQICLPLMKLQAKKPLPVTQKAQTSDSSCDSSSESSSSSRGSRSPSPLRASTPSADMADSHQEQITPREADTSMQARQFFSEMLGRPLTRTEFRKQKNTLKRQLAILVQVSKRAENQLPKQEPGEPQPGTSKDLNGSDNVDSSDDTPQRRRNNTQ